MIRTTRLIFFCLIFIIGCAGPGQFWFQQSWAERTLQHLTLREKIAQMMVYNMNMRFLNEDSRQWKEIQELLATDGIGHIHVWFGDVGSSLTLLNEIQARSKVPVLVNADIENGVGRRFASGTQLPPLMALAATGDPENAYEAAKIAALEGRSVGIQLNFSPVMDVNNNPNNPIINTRSFGEDPETVIRFGTRFIAGLQDNGMLSTAKHFPGHGDTETDSHTALAEIPSDSVRLWTVELQPFQAAVTAGADLIMVAHLTAPDYQPHAEEPATMSRFWIQDILKDRLHFKGAVVTDAMAMGGITKNYSDDYALIHAINAGCDVIIQNYNFKKAVDIVERAVKSGMIPESRIDAAALKTLELKEKIGLNQLNQVSVEFARENLGTAAHRKSATDMASQAITLVRNQGNVLPLNPQEGDTLYIVDLYDYDNNHSESQTTSLLKRGWPDVRTFQIDKSDSLDVILTLIEKIPPGATVVINAFVNPVAYKDEIFLPETEAEFLHRINLKTNRVVLSSFGNPYIIQQFPETPVYLCAYLNSGLMNRALAGAIMGQNPIGGHLPVSIPGVARQWDGIELEAKPWTRPMITNKPGKELKRVMPYETNAKIEPVQHLLEAAVADSAWPGAVLLAAKDGKIFIHTAVGYHTYDRRIPTDRGDIFDLASLTKVVATTSAIMKLYDEGKLDLEENVVTYLPEFKGRQPAYIPQKSAITVKQLLTHTSGLEPFRTYYRLPGTVQTRWDSIFNTEPLYAPGDTTVYSDIGFMILGKVAERLSGLPLDEWTDSVIFKPLGMESTYFNPPFSRLKRIVPTEFSQREGGFVHGHVHDENAYSLGGVSGHAGLFSTARDLAIFSQMLLNGGLYGWTRIFKPETVALFTRRANVIPGSSRCLGWDTPSGEASGGVYLSSTSFGHTGFTGTSLWIDPENKLFVILLTNAVHPDRSCKHPKYYEWRQRIHSAVYESVGLTTKNPDLQWKHRWKQAN
jgi:beta-glucosidase-like glycosyl hydrolase/CubicO group peptidase (beta-lactamase class C family)